MKSLFDLPAHPFFIHLPLVAVPFIAVGAVAMAMCPGWRIRGHDVLAGSTLVAAGGAVLAARSGGELNAVLKDRIGDIAADHQALGETTVRLSIAFFVGAAAVAVMARLAVVAEREVVHRVVMAVTAMVGVLAATWMVRTGHEGSSIVWDGVIGE